VKAQILIPLEEDKENVVRGRRPTVDALRAADLILNITIQQGAFGIWGCVHKASGERGACGISTSSLGILGVVVIQRAPAYIPEEALDQAMITRRHIVRRLPEDGKQMCCSGLDRATMI